MLNPRVAFTLTLAIGFGCFGQLLTAAMITPISYDMPNGYGQASSGSFNYWDRNYSGAGSTTTDGSPLSGGLGDLTDGIIATGNWNVVENTAGTGPYVGWRLIDPTLLFHFASPTAFDFVRVDLDDADGFGGVSFPSSIIVNGLTFALTDPAGTAPNSVILPLNGLTTDQLSIQLLRNNEWVFASEFTFEGRISSTGVPESASFLAWAVGILSLVSIARLQSARSRMASGPHRFA